MMTTANLKSKRVPRRVLRACLSVFAFLGFSGFAAEGALGQTAANGELANLYLPQRYQARRESSANPDLHSNGDGQQLEKGQTHVIGELDGPGVITHIWCTVGSRDPFYGRSLVLRMYWDGADKPSVEVPLGDFFGVGHGAAADYTSAVVTISSHGRSRNCYWRMPFRKSAKITITNESDTYVTDSFYYYLDWQKHDTLPEDIGYFHARYRQEFPAKPGDYTLLETEGRGHYVGTVLSVHQMETGWFGEGDDRFYIDGEETPSLRGTGTEDYFGDGWGFRRFFTPYLGVPLWEGYFPGDRVSAYRWHIRDPIPFTKSLKVTIEHRGSVFTDLAQHLGQFFERSDWFSSVAFWYQTEPVSASEPLAPVDKRVAPYRILTGLDVKARATPPAILISNEAGVSYMPGKPDAKLEIDFEIETKGRYQISAYIMHGLMGSRYQPFLDDKPVGGELDLCMTGLDPIWVGFDLHDLEPGTHTLRFEGRGPSSRHRQWAPNLFGVHVAYLMLLRLEDMPGYHEALKAAQKKKE